jgi:hypothetical protein
MFMQTLEDVNPLHAKRLRALEVQLENYEELHQAVSSPESANNVRETRKELEEAYRIAEAIIADAPNSYSQQSSVDQPTTDNKPTTQYDEFSDNYKLSELDINEKTQTDCLAIATQIANRVASPAQIAMNTGLSLFRVLSLLKNGEFQQQIEAFDSQLSPNDSREAKTLKNLERTLATVKMERAIYATTHKELTDGEMVALGFNPRMRDLQLAMTPGGKTGYIKMVPITTRKAIGSKSRMVTEMIPELDTEMIGIELRIAERLSNLEESGKSGATKTINTYVRRKED